MGVNIAINTDGLAKLAETICYGTGLTAHGIKKIADAESYATIQKAKTETEVEILKLKGKDEVADYVLARQTKKLNNAKAVVDKATKHFAEGEKVSNEPVSQDWINRLFSITEDISDDTLQELWGQILAGEIKKPKSYSLRTLDLLKNITTEEANIFINACHFHILDRFICTESFALSLNDRLVLGETVLINEEDLSHNIEILPNNITAVPLNHKLALVLNHFNDINMNIRISIVKLSKAGYELLDLVQKPDNNEFINNLVSFIKTKGVGRITLNDIIEYNENGTFSYLTNGKEF